MLMLLEWANSKYKRLDHWPGSSIRDGVAIMINRRHLWCRLSLLMLWILFVIFILHKSISSTYPYAESDHQQQDGVEFQAMHWRTTNSDGGQLGYQERQPDRGAPPITSQRLIWEHASETHPIGNEDENKAPTREYPTRSSHMKRNPSSSSPASLSTTRKSPVSDYARQSDIFILIVQDEDMTSKIRQREDTRSSTNLYPSSFNDRATPLKSNTGQHRLVIPAHIRLLSQILDYHRIGYTMDTTRYGLPSQLLDPQGLRKFSVIVIDDFIKYTELNRWMRDQLDRHCRSNRIGVITYLIDNHRLDHHIDYDVTMNSTSNNNIHSSTHRSAKANDDNDNPSRSMTEPFPLSFEPIELNCRNVTLNQCLIDYELSDKTHILRILKRRPNFVISGELPATPNNSPLMAMSSNHVTYEPLTWAKLRGQRSPTRFRRRIVARNKLKVVKTSTQHANHNYHGTGVAHVQKRAVLQSSMPANVDYSENYNSDDRLQSVPDQVVPGDEQLDGEQFKSNNDSGDEYIPDHSSADQSSKLSDDVGEKKVLSMLDHGLYDGIRRVIFGASNHHWLDRVLLLDIIEHLSSGEIMTPLERYIQIDIDDIFVGSRGTRLNRSDVDALIATQNEFAGLIEDGFKFNLGFSGKYFKHGNDAEKIGDEHLLNNADYFTWFCHFWSHSKAHLFNDTKTLATELKKNLEFARDNKLTLIGHRHPPRAQRSDDDFKVPPTYAVAPHHSGVYPIHEELYEVWRSILNVQVTSTEEYPHLRPASYRRGFVHRAIKVLPRQTCGLYTHTIYKSKYPGGFRKLLASIRGGELFETILHNPVNIYMTHMSNYGNDRLAPLTFRALIEFVQENTNLKLKYAPSVSSGGVAEGGDPSGQALGPMSLANYYFSLYPEEVEPLWTDPCRDKRHLAIWSPRKWQLCQVVPRLVIVGPQKTGTTALQSFMKLNPSIKTSSISPDDFEEVQFFNDKHYYKGSDWYFERFLGGGHDGDENESQPVSEAANDTASFYVDKSATYFDDPKAPKRASSLLPDAHIVILLIDPAARAYSWYQHVRAHRDLVANEMTFDQVIMFQETTSAPWATSSDSVKATAGVLNDTGAPAAAAAMVRGRAFSAAQLAAIKALRNRCLHPGYYSSHLIGWLNHYPPQQITIIDGEWFKYNPAAVMNRLQLLLRLPRQVDYTDLLAYSNSKGFYCEKAATDHLSVQRGPPKLGRAQGQHRERRYRQEVRCLGSGKGRKYAPMSEEARKYLNNHYWHHNRQLAKLLYEIGQPLPDWLDKSINPLPTTMNRLL